MSAESPILPDLSQLSEDEYWQQYYAAYDRCTAQDICCKCCDKHVMTCPYWQSLRATVNPSPRERQLCTLVGTLARTLARE